MNLSQAKPTPKQLNLNKLSDAGGSQIHWQATLAKTDSSSDFGINASVNCLNCSGVVSGDCVSKT